MSVVSIIAGQSAPVPGTLQSAPSWAIDIIGDYAIQDTVTNVTVASGALGTPNNGWNVTGTGSPYTISTPVTAAIHTYSYFVTTETLPYEGVLGPFQVIAAPPTVAPVGISGLQTIQLLRGIKMNCIIPLNEIYIQDNISGLAFPFGFQVIDNINPSLVQITPGLINLGGTAGNMNVGIRIYREIVASNGMLVTGYGSQIHRSQPIYTQLAALPVLLPWKGNLNMFIEFIGLTSPVPANSSLEMVITPAN